MGLIGCIPPVILFVLVMPQCLKLCVEVRLHDAHRPGGRHLINGHGKTLSDFGGITVLLKPTPVQSMCATLVKNTCLIGMV